MGLSTCCVQSLQRSFRSSGTSSLLESRESAAYWAYHLGRMGFFTVQGIAGAMRESITHVLLQQLAPCHSCCCEQNLLHCHK